MPQAETQAAAATAGAAGGAAGPAAAAPLAEARSYRRARARLSARSTAAEILTARAGDPGAPTGANNGWWLASHDDGRLGRTEQLWRSERDGSDGRGPAILARASTRGRSVAPLHGPWHGDAQSHTLVKHSAAGTTKRRGIMYGRQGGPLLPMLVRSGGAGVGRKLASSYDKFAAARRRRGAAAATAATTANGASPRGLVTGSGFRGTPVRVGTTLQAGATRRPTATSSSGGVASTSSTGTRGTESQALRLAASQSSAAEGTPRTTPQPSSMSGLEELAESRQRARDAAVPLAPANHYAAAQGAGAGWEALTALPFRTRNATRRRGDTRQSIAHPMSDSDVAVVQRQRQARASHVRSRQPSRARARTGPASARLHGFEAAAHPTVAEDSLAVAARATGRTGSRRGRHRSCSPVATPRMKTERSAESGSPRRRIRIGVMVFDKPPSARPDGRRVQAARAPRSFEELHAQLHGSPQTVSHVYGDPRTHIEYDASDPTVDPEMALRRNRGEFATYLTNALLKHVDVHATGHGNHMRGDEREKLAFI